MLIVVNCLLPYRDGVVMLQKPARGWWALPGGKVEPDERWPDAVRREVLEETGLNVSDMRLCGVHLIRIAAGEDTAEKRLTLAQFAARRVSGDLLPASREGMLQVVSPEAVMHLPMDEGDRQMIRYTLWASTQADAEVAFGKFEYTADRTLIHWEMTPALPAESVSVQA